MVINYLTEWVLLCYSCSAISILCEESVMFNKKKIAKKITFKDPIFLGLPVDIWSNIIQYASFKDILCLYLVSKASNQMMKREDIQTAHILPYQGMPMYIFRELKVDHNDLLDEIIFQLVGTAQGSKKAILRGQYYFNIVSPNKTLDYMPCVLESADLTLYRNNKKLKLTIWDLQSSLDFPAMLQGSRISKPSVIMIYPSSVDELTDIIKTFLPKKNNEIIVVCSPDRQILDKALEMKCKPLMISDHLSIKESEFILNQCIALVSKAVPKNQRNQNSCLLM